MLTLMNTSRYNSHPRGSEPLDDVITDTCESSKLLSLKTNSLYDSYPSLYTTYNKSSVDTNEFGRLQKLANGFKNTFNTKVISSHDNGTIKQAQVYPIELDDLIISSHSMKRPSTVPLKLVNTIISSQVPGDIKLQIRRYQILKSINCLLICLNPMSKILKCVSWKVKVTM